MTMSKYEKLLELERSGLIKTYRRPFPDSKSNIKTHVFQVGTNNRYIHYKCWLGHISIFLQVKIYEVSFAYFQNISPEEWLAGLDKRAKKIMLFNLDLWT